MEPDQTLKRIEDLGLLAVVRGESRGAAVEVSEVLSAEQKKRFEARAKDLYGKSSARPATPISSTR